MESTPVQQYGGIFLKREDLLERHGVRGGKLRMAYALAGHAHDYHYLGMVGAGGRRSCSASAMAAAGKDLKVPVRFHTAAGPATEEMSQAEDLGAEILRHVPGYPAVLDARARVDAEDGWLKGLKHLACVGAIYREAERTFREESEFHRIVLACGAGVHLAGICRALNNLGMNVPILAVVVGARPDEDFLDVSAADWRNHVTFVESGTSYNREHVSVYGGFRLDPLYEAKAVRFLKPGDLFWVTGIRGDHARR